MMNKFQDIVGLCSELGSNLGTNCVIVTDQVISRFENGKEQRQTCYGLTWTYCLGEQSKEWGFVPNGKERTVINADSYQVFAGMSLLDKVDWTG
jgi:hypothetical protein